MLSAGVEFIKRMALERSRAASVHLTEFLVGFRPDTLHDYKLKNDVKLAHDEVCKLNEFIAALEKTPVYAAGENGGAN